MRFYQWDLTMNIITNLIIQMVGHTAVHYIVILLWGN